jgi:hypothetical protein
VFHSARFGGATRAESFEESSPDLTFILDMPRLKILSTALFCLLAFNGRAALASSGDKDLKKM